MSFSEDIPIDGYEEDPYSGCRSLSPLPSELTITSNDQRWLKGGKQTQSNQNNMSSLFNKFIQKDKEAESLRKENQELRDKLKEFEYLIIKGSEEVKRKQSEIASLNSIIDTLKQTMPHAASIDHLQRQLDEAQRELTQTRSEAAQTQTKLRVEVQREKEMNLSLSKQVAEMKSRLDIVLQESKGSFDDLQKNFSMTSGKYMQIEKEYNDAKQLLKELTTDNEIKNQTLDQAHEVISKLKQEIENLVEDNQGLHMKVKEYKGKCKTLKKQNASAKDQMREFDNKMKEIEELQNELSQAREDHKSLMRARIEDRLKVDEKRINQSQENETLRANLSELKEQLSKLEQENSDLQSKLSELKVKYDETSSALKEKEKEFDKLHDFVKKEEERNRHELQAFKTQTLRSFHALTQGGQEMLPPLHSRQASPLKNFTRSRKQSSEMNDVSLATTAIRKGGEEGQPSRRSSILRKTTPIKLYNSKNPDGFEHRSQYQEMSDVNTLSMLTYTSPAEDKQDIKKEPARISGFDEVREIEVDKLSMYKEEVKEDEPKNNLTVACLSEELQYSLERENYLSLLIETLYTKAEFEVKRYMKKLEEKAPENPEVEAWNTKGEELEQKHNEILEKYASTSDIIMELTKNNKVLSEKLDTVIKEYNLINKKYKDLLKHSNEEQVAYQKLNKGLLEDTKSFMNTFNRLKSLSQGIHPGEIERIIDDYEVYQNELKNIEDFIDGLQVPENTQSLQSLLKETKKKIAQEASQGEHFAKTKGSEMSLLSKISRKIELYENKLRQMQEERAELNTKLNDLKGDIKNWKEAADAIEKDYQASIRDKDESLKNTESALKRTEALLAEQEYLSNKQSERLNEFAGRDMSASLFLQEKESFIKDLLNQKHELCERLDEINQFSANMKREMTEKMKELSYKNDALSELEGELMQKDQELNMKDMKIEEKIEQIFDLEQIILTKDREILQLRNDNIDLQSQVFGLKEEKTRIEYAYNLAQSRGTPSREMRMSVSSTKTLEERPEKREGSRAGSARRKERPSVPNLKKEDYQPRMSCGSQSEKYNLTEKENSMKQLKKENAQLAKENDQLFHKLNKLNELIVSNKALEEEVGVLRAAQMSRNNQYDNFTRSPLKEAGRRTVSGTFDANFLEKCLQLPDEPQQEKDALKQLKENIKDTASIQYVEKYKAKTKKVFQKRVKELEILLKFLDHKVRGCKFENSSYIVCSINRDPPSVEEGKALVRMNYLVENMLEKNTNLKNFVGELVKKIETIYIKNHNLTVILGKLLQNMFMSCAQNQKDLSPSQMQLQSELGGLSQCTIPEVVVDYEQIETKVQNGGGSFSQQFFSLFAKLEPKIHTLSKILLQNLTHHNAPKTSAPVSSIKDEDYLNSKVQKIREVENLYSKLTEIIHRNNDMNLSLPDYAHDYIQTYNHIYGAVINEVYSIMNFTSNLLSGNKLTSEDDLQSYNITYETEQANATAKLNSMNDSSKDLEGRFRLAGKKRTEDSYTFQMNHPSSVLHDQRVNSIESPSPKKESLQLQSKSSPYTPPKFDENQKYGFVDSQFENSRRRGKTQRSSVKTNDERENKWMQTSRY